MSKKTLLIVSLVIIFAGSVAFLLLSPDEAAAPNEANSSTTQKNVTNEDETPTQQPAPQASAGAYVDYSEDVIAQTEGTKILFFHAPWCPQCRAAEASIQQSRPLDGVTIIKVDYDSNQALRQKYGVTIQTTFVKVDDNGNKVESFVAYDDPSFGAVKENLL